MIHAHFRGPEHPAFRDVPVPGPGVHPRSSPPGWGTSTSDAGTPTSALTRIIEELPRRHRRPQRSVPAGGDPDHRGHGGLVPALHRLDRDC
ncbi:MAG: hypothetical protein MZV70_71845 [Desulfobacterales bacterium]|nr:hypothetical protein [Desulfobacterales bacterium]